MWLSAAAEASLSKPGPPRWELTTTSVAPRSFASAIAVVRAASPSGLGTYPTTTVAMLARYSDPSPGKPLWKTGARVECLCGTLLQEAGMEEGIVEPVARELHVRLRRAVLDHARTERRRVFPPVLQWGPR